MWSNSVAIRNIRLQNLSDPEFDLLRLVKFKCDAGIGLLVYGFIWPNSFLYEI